LEKAAADFAQICSDLKTSKFPFICCCFLKNYLKAIQLCYNGEEVRQTGGVAFFKLANCSQRPIVLFSKTNSSVLKDQ
jgi:hypothetical protein